MAGTKNIGLNWSSTGVTAYLIIRREADSYLLDDADGTFAAAPADPYVAMAEHATLKGRYYKAESRTVWDDGYYQMFIYEQAGGSPSPVADTMIGSGILHIETDAESLLSSKLSERRADYLDSLAPATDTPAAPTFDAEPGALATNTYGYKVAALNAWGESIASAEATQATVLLATPVASYASEEAGTLAPGTYYYRVSAINAVGETLASTEIDHTLSGTGGIKIDWPAVSGSTGYRVYGRATGAELLLEEIGAVLEYTDDGSLTPSGALPTANDTSGIEVNWVAVTGATGYRIYGRTAGDTSFLVDVSGQATVLWIDTGSASPDTGIRPKTADSTGLEGQITSNRTDIEGVAAQTDRINFDGDDNVESTKGYPTGTVATDGGNGSSVFKTNRTETADDHWTGAYVKFEDGLLINQVRRVLSYNGTTKVITMYSAFTGTPADGDAFKLINE